MAAQASPSPSHIVGIDLGTTHTVVAYAAPGCEDIRVFDIEQLVAPGAVAARPWLPSARYHPSPQEFAGGGLQLPGQPRDVAGLERVVIGTLARQLGAQVPGRVVTSAKSWLSHPSVDRMAAILPWGAPEAVDKVSPVGASASYLAHVRHAWNRRFPEAPLEAQELVLTVPASFDEGARRLTVEAARMAGLLKARLLEEPQAAFYDWLFRHRLTLREDLAHTRLVLVCDVGGGTTDMTLIQVDSHGDRPVLKRIGVGDHLMLGGDNMDLALARLAEAELGQALSGAELTQLLEQCRAAKEQLLSEGGPERVSVTLLGAGSRLVGGSRSVMLTREALDAMIVEGFFPRVPADEAPQRVRGGIVEFGLPYVSDPAITRHMAAFLARHAQVSREALGLTDTAALAMPDALLLNGGVFRAVALGERVRGVLGDWRGAPVHVLDNAHPETAVASGAVAYGLARQGKSPCIGGGSARSYFLMVDSQGSARQAVCLLPRATEEGREIELAQRDFTLRLGQPVRFRLASLSSDAAYAPGELVTLTDEFVFLPPLTTIVPKGEADAARITVHLRTALTAIGTLELSCVSAQASARRWRLEFDLRAATETSSHQGSAPIHRHFSEAAQRIDRIFGAQGQPVEPRDLKHLRHDLERWLGMRETWDTALLRELFALLWERARRRRRSPDHERLWLNLAGYCLRPGFGYPLDDWRATQLWSIFPSGVQYARDSRVWSEWWTLWRRVAGGLPEKAQIEILDALALSSHTPEAAARKSPTAKVQGYDHQVRLAASLERLPIERKIALAEGLFPQLAVPQEQPLVCWAIGRIGARIGLYGSPHAVIAPEIAADWLRRLLAVDWKTVEPAAFAAAQIARMTGDRTHDLPAELREQVAQRLRAVKATPTWITMVREVSRLDDAAERHIFGESLPPGLTLIR
ncbi:MAG: hsp70 family protein [Betaproteobacteria bacterium]|nr:hsp70 family protein [Betaproteobacteria bacterium]